MDKAMLKEEIEATRKKLAALEVLACDDKEEKEAAAKMIKCPDCGTKVLEATKYCLKCKKKIKVGKEKEAAKNIIASLDEIASLLENQNDPELLKLAFEIDRVSDVLEGKKEASTLEGDKDETYMKEHFKAGAPETDKDEPYMKEFDTDTSKELDDKFTKKQLGKDASNMPYQIIE